MFSLFAKENLAELQKAVNDLKTVLAGCFTAEEKRGHTLKLIRQIGLNHKVDLFAEKDPENLVYYVKQSSNKTLYSLLLSPEDEQHGENNRDIVVANFQVEQMPGCCGVAVSMGAYTNEDFRGRGIGTALNRFRIAIAKASGYSAMMCTTLEDGVTSKILKKNGWREVGKFTNRRTDNRIAVFMIYIQ